MQKTYTEIDSTDFSDSQYILEEVMTIDTIENEIDIFLDIFFKEIIEISENEFSFIQDNKLYSPKDNYFFILDFLYNTISHFIHLDYKIKDNLSNKLYKDIQSLRKFYNTNKNLDLNIDDIFNKQFIDTSKILIKMIENISDEKSKKTYKKLSLIYSQRFSDLFLKRRKKLLYSLLLSINTKIFHLDRMIWLEAKNSESVTRYLKIIKIKDAINSSKYIAYKLEKEAYSKNYIYLQQCLKVYK